MSDVDGCVGEDNRHVLLLLEQIGRLRRQAQLQIQLQVGPSLELVLVRWW